MRTVLRRPRSLALGCAAPLLAILVLTVTGACVVRDADHDTTGSGPQAPAPPAAPAAAPAVDPSTPARGYRQVDEARLDRERLDESWRAAADRDLERRHEAGEAGGETGAATGGSGSAAPAGGEAGGAAEAGASEGAGTPGGAVAAPVEAMRSGGAPPAAGSAAPAASGPAGAESWDDISPDAYDDFQPVLPVDREGGGPTILALQRMLDRVRFSPGVLDGRWGKNTEKAVYWLQDALGLEATGTPDRALWDRLVAQVGTADPLTEITLSADDLAGPFVDIPEDVEAQSELDCLCYASAREELAERFHTTPELLAQLNPDLDLAALAAGDRLVVPDVERVEPRQGGGGRVARIEISKDGFYLHALDDRGRLLYHFPSTVGAGYDPSPTGELRVTALDYRPEFHYQPKLFHEVPDSRPDALLPAGPNSPVGLVWMQLSKENYGIHGTAAPATIGYATSHGCVRLTNWDALFLANHTTAGTPVRFLGGGEAAAGG